MADLVTHVAVVFLPARTLMADARVRALVYLGACLPDLLYKAGVYALGAPTWFCEPTHSPLGLVPICWAAALLFEERWRRRAFGALWAGGLAHLLVDLGKDYMGSGVILWAFPFTMDRVELGGYAPEDTLFFMAPAAVAIALVEGMARRAQIPRRSTAS
jgi:hypothetical protein